ncbi:S-adenosyl-L-methionine-dependent methyltransferase [Venturia nashicola]|nr:S-adenosyl-L-methionine-dependent methyltransferase [Venturia nashicola]
MPIPTGASRLSELTAIISANTKTIEQYLANNDLPALSNDVDAPKDFPVPSTNEEIQKARRAVVNATQELHDLMYNDNLSLLAVYQFRVAHIVPLHGDISYTDIAKAAGADELDLRRLIRHAMTNRVFKEPRDGYVSHTAASRVLLDDVQMNDWVGLCTAEFFQAASQTVNAMRLHPSSEEPDHTGYSLAHGPGMSMFTILGSEPQRAIRFGNAMASLTGGEGYEVSHIVDNYPWADLGKATVVDVGGSIGFVCVALAKKFPELSFVVQDLPKTVADGPANVPIEFKDRIEFQPHDFYKPQPVKDADVYFFRWICHNQSDKYGVIMLQALIPALKKGARIIINDNCLPKPNTVDPWDEKITRTMDVTMLELLNAKERDVEAWTQLFAMAHPGFKFLGARQPKGSRMSIMEAIWDPEVPSVAAS